MTIFFWSDPSAILKFPTVTGGLLTDIFTWTDNLLFPLEDINWETSFFNITCSFIRADTANTVMPAPFHNLFLGYTFGIHMTNDSSSEAVVVYLCSITPSRYKHLFQSATKQVMTSFSASSYMQTIPLRKLLEIVFAYSKIRKVSSS